MGIQSEKDANIPYIPFFLECTRNHGVVTPKRMALQVKSDGPVKLNHDMGHHQIIVFVHRGGLFPKSQEF